MKHRPKIDARICEIRKRLQTGMKEAGVDITKELVIKILLNFIHGEMGAKPADILKALEIASRIQGYDAPTKIEQTHNIPTLTEVLADLDARHARNALPVAVDIVDAVVVKSDTPATLPA